MKIFLLFVFAAFLLVVDGHFPVYRAFGVERKPLDVVSVLLTYFHFINSHFLCQTTFPFLFMRKKS